MNAPKENKQASASESGIRKQKQQKAKLIRLDDLIPKGNVKGGGGQLLFGATDTKPTTQKQEG